MSSRASVGRKQRGQPNRRPGKLFCIAVCVCVCAMCRVSVCGVYLPRSYAIAIGALGASRTKIPVLPRGRQDRGPWQEEGQGRQPESPAVGLQRTNPKPGPVRRGLRAMRPCKWCVKGLFVTTRTHKLTPPKQAAATPRAPQSLWHLRLRSLWPTRLPTRRRPSCPRWMRITCRPAISRWPTCSDSVLYRPFAYYSFLSLLFLLFLFPHFPMER